MCNGNEARESDEKRWVDIWSKLKEVFQSVGGGGNLSCSAQGCTLVGESYLPCLGRTQLREKGLHVSFQSDLCHS